jgi:beta-galactosidase
LTFVLFDEVALFAAVITLLRNRCALYVLLCACTLGGRGVVAAESSFNSGWRFHLGEASAACAKDYDDSSWSEVNLPHTPRIEALVIGANGPESEQWQGVCWYRKRFTLDSSAAGKTILIKLGAAMRVADVWVNERFVGRNQGGYLPVVLNVSAFVRPGRENVIAVRLDNFDNPVTGPKPLAQLDFNFFGGLYRDAELIVKDRLHITDPLLAEKPAGGGVFVTFPDVSESQAVVRVQTHAQNDYPGACDAVVRTSLFDADRMLVKQSDSPQATISPGDNAEFVQELSVLNPHLWSPEDPHLYIVQTELLSDGAVVDRHQTRVGIRRVKITKDGLWLNGKKSFLRGVNRHQEYPYIGYALPDNAQYRDAKKIKDAGFDFVRLSHYPQSPAFLNACDELGLMVIDCVMGWQYFADVPEFKQLQYQQCRELIRRDRNHPCVLLWEVSLNESQMSDDFMRTMQKIAHEEYPGDQCYTCGWEGDYDVFIQARQHGGCRDCRSRPCMVSEYGDWEYYAQNAGFNQEAWKNLRPAERSSRQDRSDGELRLLQQALNFQEAHNDNLATKAFADCLWVMFDYNRGYSSDLETSGCMDIFRLPKPSYYLFQSQRPASERLNNAQSGPMVRIANEWTAASPTAVRVFSNCQQVVLYLNDVLVGTQYADDDRFSTHLGNPPFTFDVGRYDPGSLRAVGLIDGRESATNVVRTPRSPVRLRMQVDLSGRPLSVSKEDIVFVHAWIEDEQGTVNSADSRAVSFEVEGPAELIGDNPLEARAGVASILLRTKPGPDKIQVTARADGLESGHVVVREAEVP